MAPGYSVASAESDGLAPGAGPRGDQGLKGQLVEAFMHAERYANNLRRGWIFAVTVIGHSTSSLSEWSNWSFGLHGCRLSWLVICGAA